MTIELKITADTQDDLRQQIGALADAFRLMGRANDGRLLAQVVEEVGLNNSPKPINLAVGKGGPGGAFVGAAEPPQQQSTATTRDAPTASPSDAFPDYERDVKPAVLRVSAKHGRPGVERLLEPFGVTNAKQLEPHQYAALIEAADKAVED